MNPTETLKWIGSRWARSELPTGFPMMEVEKVFEAARAYADLLENGQEVIARDRLTGWNPVMEVPEPGRYLIVRVGESP